MEKWIVFAKKADFNQIAKKYNISPMLARIIRNKDIIEDKDIKEYLYGDINELNSPWLLKDMEKAVEIIKIKISQQNKIRIICDYDIDGICSGYILLDSLEKLGANVDIVVPHRIEDGYGINKDLIKKQLESAKAQNPDVICVSMHWGIEYKLQPNTEQKDLADYLFENGADIILGSHPHVLEPMEKRTVTLSDGTKKDGFVIYSLGNFISAQKDKYTKDSIILNLKITKHSQGNITIDSYDYTPIYMQDNGANAKNRYELVDLEKKIKDYENGDKSITATAYKTYVAELKNVKTALGEDKQ